MIRTKNAIPFLCIGLAIGLAAISAPSMAARKTKRATAKATTLEGNDKILADWTTLVRNANRGAVDAASDAAGGVDGVKSGGFGFHTPLEKQPSWWQVDLGAVQTLDRVVVYNRDGQPADRANHLLILLSDDGELWREVYRHDGTIFHGHEDNKPLIVPLDARTARYVRTAMPHPQYLHLDEIEVYGVGNKKKNIALHQPATQSSISQWSKRSSVVAPSTEPFAPKDAPEAKRIVRGLLAWTGRAGAPLREQMETLAKAAPETPEQLTAYGLAWATLHADASQLRARFVGVRESLDRLDIAALRRAVGDLSQTYPDRYRNGQALLTEIDRLAERLPQLKMALSAADAETQEKALDEAEKAVALQRRALLANPLLDFDKLLLVKRGEGQLGLPANWQGNCAVPTNGYDNEIASFSPLEANAKLTTFYRPDNGGFVGDVEMHFDADRMLFSMPGSHGRWQIWEIGADGKNLRQVTPGEHVDVDNYDACYLPDGRIIFDSTRFFHGVPCVRGDSSVANLYIMNNDGGAIRQLCFDQDHDWCPAVLPNGRVLYTRWEYTDTPHSNTRLLFQMNPDGTGQTEYSAGNSFWPNGVFYARPTPPSGPGETSTKVIGIVTGHHGVARMGELVLFDPARGRQEATGAVQRIPGFGQKVEPIIRDQLVNDSWPKFLHPYPLSDKYFLVSCKPTPDALWGVYLVDVFDNILLLKEEPGYVLFEPTPLLKVPTPPVVPDKVDLERKDAVVYIADIHAGGGLEGIPRGAVKEMRIFTYLYSYRGTGGLLGVIGMDGPWDIKRVLGTVPVQEDGSVLFRVPANTPISVQPLDADGRALQLMRSWMTAMPGEIVSCAGCHEKQNTSPATKMTLASRMVPSEIKPWRGPTRGFNFHREVQPVLDKYCVGCHDGEPRHGAVALDLRGERLIDDWRSITPGNGGADGGKFSVAYANLHRFVRRSGIESDYHMLSPMEFHASTTELGQMLRKGHHNVQLDAEAFDRINTWIDLNAPYHGTWTEIVGEKRVRAHNERRQEMIRLYGGPEGDPEAIAEAPSTELAAQHDIKPIMPEPSRDAAPSTPTKCPDWPFDPQEARSRQAKTGPPSRAISLGDGIELELTLIPAGSFVMGDPAGHSDERPPAPVRIDKPFWMGKFEITNAQFSQFDSKHDSRLEPKHAYQFGVDGFHVDGDSQPVVRVSWERAVAFCEWLGERAGESFSLPTEAQWEYACRAGSDTPFSYGDLDADFSKFANLGDIKLSEFADDPYMIRSPLPNPPRYDDWIPRDTRFNDGGLVTEDVGAYAPNPWNLHDMHGNASEWTRSAYRPYPYRENDGRNNLETSGDKVARGGSWYDRPQRSRSAFRLAYRPYQRVFNVGFRVACPVSQTLLSQATR